MTTTGTRRTATTTGLVLAAGLLMHPLASDAANPRLASYCQDHANVLWFVQISDPHIGTSGSADSDRLTWIVTTGRSVIQPSFIVATGDLTDSTNGNFLGFPNGPYQAEWDRYTAILTAAGAGANVYFDLPGNHDAYNDRYFAYYLANSVQGRAAGSTQVSWTRDLPLGTYHFLGVNTADNTGAGFSLGWPYGDYAGTRRDGTRIHQPATWGAGRRPPRAGVRASPGHRHGGQHRHLALLRPPGVRRGARTWGGPRCTDTATRTTTPTRSSPATRTPAPW